MTLRSASSPRLGHSLPRPHPVPCPFRRPLPARPSGVWLSAHPRPPASPPPPAALRPLAARANDPSPPLGPSDRVPREPDTALRTPSAPSPVCRAKPNPGSGLRPGDSAPVPAELKVDGKIMHVTSIFPLNADHTSSPPDSRLLVPSCSRFGDRFSSLSSNPNTFCLKAWVPPPTPRSHTRTRTRRFPAALALLAAAARRGRSRLAALWRLCCRVRTPHLGKPAPPARLARATLSEVPLTASALPSRLEGPPPPHSPRDAPLNEPPRTLLLTLLHSSPRPSPT